MAVLKCIGLFVHTMTFIYSLHDIPLLLMHENASTSKFCAHLKLAAAYVQ